MADYYPLLARAIEGLPDKSEAGRKVVYDRARRALLNQLRAAEPTLREGDVAREQQALDAAIARLERDFARTPDAFRNLGANLANAMSDKPAPGAPSAPANPPPPSAGRGVSPPASPGAPTGGSRPVAPPPARPAAPLGRDMGRPVSQGGSDPSANAAPSAPTPAAPVAPVPPPGRPPLREPPERAPPARPPGAAAPTGGDDDDDYVSRLSVSRRDGGGWSAKGTPTAGPNPDADVATALGEGEDSVGFADEGLSPPRRGNGRILAFVIILLLLVGGGVVGFLQRDTILTLVRSLSGPTRQVAQAPAAQPEPEAAAKSNDRIAQAPGGSSATDSAPAASPAQPAPSAPAAAAATPARTDPVNINAPQRAVMFEESAGGGEQGLQQYVGSVVWSAETFQPGDGQAPDIGIRAVATIPDRNFKVTLLIRRNQDPSIPASHIVEVQFDLPPNFDLGNATSVPGMRAKASEGAQGLPLTGLAVRVAPGFFLIGLSSLDADKQRNLGLLITRNFLDLPVAFENGRRAIMVLEKGPPGDLAFRQAFMAWGLPVPNEN